MCFQADGEYFEGQSKLKWSEHMQYSRTDAQNISFETPLKSNLSRLP